MNLHDVILLHVLWTLLHGSILNPLSMLTQKEFVGPGRVIYIRQPTLAFGVDESSTSEPVSRIHTKPDGTLEQV